MRTSKFLLILSLLVSIWPSGCKRNQKQTDGINATEPNKIFLCWDQSWRCGKWRPLTYKLDSGDFLERKVPNGMLILSTCEQCSSFLLVNPEDRTERVVLSVEGRIKKCEHKWESAVHAWSFEPVEPGDMLFIIYKGEMHALMLGNIFGAPFPDQKISYKIAKIAESGRLPTNVKWRELTWQKREAKEEIPIADRKISFFADSVVMDGGRNIKKFVSIGYDNYYGGPIEQTDRMLAIGIDYFLLNIDY